MSKNLKPAERLKEAVIWVGVGIATLLLVDYVRVSNDPGAHSTLSNIYTLCKRNVTCRNFIAIDDDREPNRPSAQAPSAPADQPTPGKP